MTTHISPGTAVAPVHQFDTDRKRVGWLRGSPSSRISRASPDCDNPSRSSAARKVSASLRG
jgi:hypothetical protein